MTNEMKERTERLGAKWYDEGGGYFSLISTVFGCVAYVAIPPKHKLVGTEYDDIDADVNGGMTFANGNVFGWDYAHARNRNDVSSDIENALAFFRGKEK